MAQLKKVVEPFGEVNVYPTDRGVFRIVATILMEPRKQGAQTGIALDGSSSMRFMYGAIPGTVNQMTFVAQRICAYLARRIDADGGTTVIRWATGLRGDQIEVVGDLTAEQAEQHTFGPPREFGTESQLLPAVEYFVERFQDAPWGFYVFLTDGDVHDLGMVKRYSVSLARDVAAGKRNPVKLVLVGVGPDINEGQMQELDDLETGTNIDLWDHKIAREMRVLQEIFAEVVDRNTRVADQGRIVAPDGTVVKDYSQTGVPAYLEFELPEGSEFFVLEMGERRIRQEVPDPRVRPPSPIPRISSRRPQPAPVARKGCLLVLLALLAAIWHNE